jgi:hypothetical protein
VTEESSADAAPEAGQATAHEAGQAAPRDAGLAASEAATGDGRVDAALARLDALAELPVAEHVAQYDALHRTLQDALAGIDEG